MQLPIFDEQTETNAEITTHGKVLKPWLKSLNKIVDEAKFDFDDNGIHVTAVDVANVILINTSLKADAFESYDTQDFTQGFDVGKFAYACRRARVGSDDTLDLKVGNNELRTQVARGYDDVNVVSNDSLKAIDPDSIREKPDIPELDLPFEAEIQTDAFLDAVTHALDLDSKFTVGSVDGNLSFKGESVVVMDGISHTADEPTHYSSSYIQSITEMLKKVGPESVTLTWGTEYPIFVGFDTEFAEYEVMLAPRITND